MANKNIKLLTWFNFCLDFRLYDAVAIIYFAQVTGSYALGLTIFSIGSISAALFEVPTGVFSDLIGRKMTLLMGAVASTLAVGLYAVGGSFWVLALGSLFNGLSFALFSGNNNAFIFDTLKETGKEQEYAKVYGQTGSMFQFALAASALVGSFVLGVESFKWVLWLSVIPQVIGMVLVSLMTEPKKHYKNIDTNIFSHVKESFKLIKDNFKLRMLSFAQILDYGLGEALHQFSPAFIATLWPVWAIGLARVLNHLCAAIGMRVAGGLIKKYGEIKLLISSYTPSWVIGVLAIAFPTVASPLIGSVLSLPFGFANVARNGLLQQEFTDKQRATIASLNSLAGSLLFALLAVVFGIYADKYGPRIALLTGQIISIISLYFYLKISKANKTTA